MRQTPYNWPNFQNSKIVDKDGNLTGQWQMIMQQFFSYAQTNLSNEGFRLPQQTSSNITMLSPMTAPGDPTKGVPNGTMFYNTTNNTFQVKIDGAIKTVTVS